jgi:hypothetical protein
MAICKNVYNDIHCKADIRYQYWWRCDTKSSFEKVVEQNDMFLSSQDKMCLSNVLLGHIDNGVDIAQNKIEHPSAHISRYHGTDISH